jgi:endoglucanase
MPDLETGDGCESVRRKKQYSKISRREFLSLLSSGGTAALLASCLPKQLSTPSSASQPPLVVPDTTYTQNAIGPISFANLPRWRGFNLLQKYRIDIPEWNKPFHESDLDIIAEWGFDFIRLPMDYRIWTISSNQYREKPLKEIDQVIEWAQLRGIHVNLCLHRAPGYCVNPPKEPLNLWIDDASGEEARQLFAEQWLMFSERYQNIPSWKLSFNLINEPPNISGEIYTRSVSLAINAIRQTDPDRLIIADGSRHGTQPVYELVPFQIAQSTRGYAPFSITHYRASWVKGSDQWPIPTWPLQYQNNELSAFNKEMLWVKHVEPWKKFHLEQGIGIHVGEWGAYNKTPHEVVLGWMEDCLQNWKLAGMGWALWNLHGGFGLLDSNRADVVYENYKGQKLDRKMLELLKQF